MSISHPSQGAVPELEAGKTRTRRLVRAVAVAAALGVASAGGYLVGDRDGTAASARPAVSPRASQQSPAWFQNIAKSYGYDPRLTPEFDFASLYGVPPVEPALTHHGAPEGTR
jgi:hypothetical protein